MAEEDKRHTYRQSGVDAAAEEAAMKGISRRIRETFTYNPNSRVVLDLGHYANVIDVGSGPWLALSTDSVGTKQLISLAMDKHDTVGIDCVAMAANDLICVGAEPVAMLDCIGITHADQRVLEELVEGLREGAYRAEVSIPGGETAQVAELLAGEGKEIHYDLVGTAIGTVGRDALILGDRMEEGDVVVGIAATGLHSNGYTLARRVLQDAMGLKLDSHHPELGRTVGEEMLEPTAMYVREVKAMLREELPLHGLANMTGGGMCNLPRLETEGIGFVLDELPEPNPVFQVIQQGGNVAVEEMYSVFNMGVGFCVVCPRDAADRVIALCKAEGKAAQVIGRTVKDPEEKLALPGLGLVGDDKTLRPA